MAPAIADAAKLPGAFLFLTVRETPEGDFAMIAYDPEIKKNTTIKDLKLKYLSNGFPYMERFAKYASAGDKVWEGKPLISYGGVFGGPDPKDPKHIKRSPLSNPWPFVDTDNAAIHHGVYISYWWFSEAGKGLHTSSIHKAFQKGSEVPYWTLYRGNPNSLVAPTWLLKDKAKSITIDWYATLSEGDLGWSSETI